MGSAAADKSVLRGVAVEELVDVRRVDTWERAGRQCSEQMAVRPCRRPGMADPLRRELLRWTAAAGRRRARGLAAALGVGAAEPLRVLERHADGDGELPTAAGLDMRRTEEGAFRSVGVLRVRRVTVGRGEHAAARVLPAGQLPFDGAAGVGRVW